MDFIDKITTSNIHDSVCLSNVVSSHAYFMGTPLNYNPKDSLNSQQLDPVTLISYGLVVTTSDSIKKTRNMVGQNPLLVDLGLIEGWDIDYMDEFDIAELIFKSKSYF